MNGFQLISGAAGTLENSRISRLAGPVITINDGHARRTYRQLLIFCNRVDVKQILDGPQLNMCVFLDLRVLNKPEVFANAFAGGFDANGNLKGAPTTVYTFRKNTLTPY